MKPAAVFGPAARLSKLRAMTPREIIGRVTYRCATTIEREMHRRGKLAPHDRLQRGLAGGLRGSSWQAALLESRRTAASRFFPSVREKDAIRDLFAGEYSAERRDTLDQARRARDRRFEFFGQEYHYPGEIDWQADPVTGKRWPSTYHASVPVHGGDVGYGDVKHVWELSRQQYLIDLGKSFFLTRNPDDLSALRSLVSSWIAGNPYGTGVNWSCALEPAFRAWSWLWAYHLTAGDLDDAFHFDWLRSFLDHGRFLYRHLEHFSSPYNHLIGEASALFALGHCFPEFREASKWRRLGRTVLEERLKDQFYPDGGTVEQSTVYHHATVGFYLLSALIGRANGEELSRSIWGAIERGLEFSMHLAEPDGTTPEIGGADDGKPIRMEHLPFWDFRPYQAIGAVLFQRPEFKQVAGRFYEDALWLLGTEGRAAFDRLDSHAPQTMTAVYPASGYVVSRSAWTPDADYICIDIGEQAAGMRTDAVPNSMHGHADCLSIVVSLAGRRVLVDSGLFAYNCGGDWEAHFRETAAHNTARIDGRDQALHLGKMAWSNSYRAALEATHADERQAWAVGSHDGYARGTDGVTHRRTVWRRPGGYVVVHDEFVGSGSHAVEVNYQCAPGELRLHPDDRAVFDGFAEICWIAEGTWSSETRAGGEGPADGWICSSLGVRVAAPRLTLRGTFDRGRAALLTVIADRPGRIVRSSDEGRAIAVRGDGYVDWIAAAGLSAPRGVSTDARVAICRMAGDTEIERAMIAGNSLAVDEAALGAAVHRLPGPPTS